MLVGGDKLVSRFYDFTAGSWSYFAGDCKSKFCHWRLCDISDNDGGFRLMLIEVQNERL
jgi:hypothetical protein